MPTNFSTTRNFPYGVFSGNSCMGLVEDIQNNGVSLSMKAQEEQIDNAIHEIQDLVADKPEWPDFCTGMTKILKAEPFSIEENDEIIEAIAELESNFTAEPQDDDRPDRIVAVGNPGPLKTDLQHLVSESMEGPEEESFFWEAGDCKLQLGWLGGAILIWVIDSSYITNAGACSPCVPGACDLDNPRGETNGSPCLCLPPSYYKDYEWEAESVPLFIQEIDDTGNLVSKVLSHQEFMANG